MLPIKTTKSGYSYIDFEELFEKESAKAMELSEQHADNVATKGTTKWLDRAAGFQDGYIACLNMMMMELSSINV